jgi:hypothetical protein
MSGFDILSVSGVRSTTMPALIIAIGGGQVLQI